MLELEFKKELNKNKLLKICDQKKVANNMKWAIKKVKKKKYYLVSKKKIDNEFIKGKIIHYKAFLQRPRCAVCNSKKLTFLKQKHSSKMLKPKVLVL